MLAPWPPGGALQFLAPEQGLRARRENPDALVVALLQVVCFATQGSLRITMRPVNHAVDTSSSTPPLQVRRKLRVLIADDERDTVLTLMELLRDEGHETRGLHKASDVMAAVKVFDPDVVLLDIAMPEMSGWDVAREIRRNCGESRPLLIAISGVYKQSADQILGKLAGFNYYLAKPYDPSVLLSLLYGGIA
jgi:CheY-like chemotaxis protein